MAVDGSTKVELVQENDFDERPARGKPMSAEEVSELQTEKVFVGVSLNEQRAKKVWEINPENLVVRIREADHYALCDRYSGWKKLKEVNLR